MALQPGEILDGKYRIVRLVGEGGMGAVYEGENTRIKRKVAIKVLHGSVAEKQDVVQRFEREAQAAGRIGSEHIVEVLDLGSLPSGERYMVMEFLEGEDLTGRIKRFKRVHPEHCVPILEQVLEGLAAAHDASIVHRDLKPDNIYILTRHAGHNDFVKILDFGVSKFSALDDQMSMTKTGSVMGTPYYMSPEQAKGSKVDNRSDLYAIGVVAYQMVTGRVPFNAGSFNELLFKIVLESPEPIEHVVPGIDPAFAAIIARAMNREPEQRFQNAREFQSALRAWQPGAGMMAPAPSHLPPRNTMTSGMSASFGPSADASSRHVAALGTSQPGPQPFGGTPIPGTTPFPNAIPGAAPGVGLGVSHSALALTPQPTKKSGTVVALALVGVAIIGAGGAGAYILTRGSTPSQAATKQDAPAPAADKDKDKSGSTDPVKLDPVKSADEPAPAKSAAPEKSATTAKSAAPEKSAAVATGKGPTTAKSASSATPGPAGSAKSKAADKEKDKKGAAATSSTPPPPTQKGRQIKTDL